MTEPVDSRVDLCGSLTVELEGRRLEDGLRGRQGKLCFAYLALNRDRPVRRDELIAALRPERAPGDPDAALATLLSRMRKTLGEGVVEGSSELQLHLPEDVRVDTEEADRALERADEALAGGAPRDAWGPANLALSITRRGLLTGFEAHWIDERRRALEELRLRALETIAGIGLGLGGSEVAAAERSARALIEASPYRESGYRFLMEALARQGNAAEALRAYEELRVRLRDELGTSPAPELQELHERLLRGELPRRTAVGAPPVGVETPLDRSRTPLAGRERQLEQLGALLARTGAGERVVALLGGEPGIGKTRLALAFADSAREHGAIVMYGRCEQEPLGPYGPFREALRAHVRALPDDVLAADAAADAIELAQIVPELARRLDLGGEARGDDPETERVRLFEAIAALLNTTAGHGPLLLVIDDLHWADPSTLALLRYLTRARDSAGLLLIATYRTTEVTDGLRATLADLRRDGAAERLEARGLDEEEVRRLVDALLERPVPPSFAEALRRRTKGNPFFVQEVIRHVDETVTGALGEADLEEMGVPEGVREIVRDRLQRLDPETREALDVAAAIGAEFEVGVLARAMHVDEDEAVARLDTAIGRGLVEDAPAGQRCSFTHALVREAIYTQLSSTRTGRIHARIADALAAAEETDSVDHLAALAFHSRAAASIAPDRRESALRYGEAAGDAASSVYSNAEALARYREAAALADNGSDYAARIGEKVGDAAFRLGHFDDALSAWSDALEILAGHGEPERVAEVERKLGGALRAGGKHAEARAHYQHGIGLLRELPPCLELVRLFEDATSLYMHTSDNMLALYSAEKALAVAAHLGDQRAVIRGHAVFGRVYGRTGQFKRANESLDRALQLAREEGDDDELARALRMKGDHLAESGAAYAEARDTYLESLELARRIGDGTTEVELHWLLGRLDVLSARWDEAAGHGEAGAELARRQGIEGRGAGALALEGALAWRNAELERAQQRLLEAAASADGVQWFGVSVTARQWLGTVRRDREDLAAAAEVLADAAAVAAGAGVAHEAAEANALLAGVLALSGDPGGAAEAAAETARLAAEGASPSAAAATLEARGTADADLTTGAKTLDEARAAWEQLGRPLDVARCALLSARLSSALRSGR